MTSPTAKERGAAVASLLSLAGAIVLTVVGVVSDWQGLLTTLGGLLLIVVGGWYAVSRRGAVRSIALVVALAGAGLFVAGFFVADLSALRLLAIVVLAGISVATARLALGRTPMVMTARALPRTRYRSD